MQYYEQCRQARDLPSIPGAVIISCDEKLSFEPIEAGAVVGRLKVPERGESCARLTVSTGCLRSTPTSTT